MHVEVSVALNFLISYLYNKLPRRRVDLFGEELEKGLKKKFEGHWYPDKPFKGSGFRCVRCNGEKVDPVLMTAARNAGLDLTEVKNYIPEELTLWIDPSEVSYRISEKSPIKILYSDRHEDEGCDASNDREVQAANHTFNPEALSFQPIIVDSLSSSLTSLSLSPSSPVPPPGTWSNSVSPASLSPSLFPPPLSSSSTSSSSSSNSASSCSSSSIAPPTLLLQQTSPSSLAPPQALSPTPPTSALPPPPPPTTNGQAQAQAQATAPVLMGKSSVRPQFTAATFAATKFGSTKLKSQAKRPTRLSPTELGNYFRQQQRTGFAVPPAAAAAATSPQRPRSLSPRDPRLEFLIDQQQRFYPRGGPCPSQLSPQGHHSLSQTLQQQHQQQQQQQQQQHHHHHQQQQPQHHHQQQQQMSFSPSPVSPNNNNYSLPFPPTSLVVGSGGGGSGANTPSPSHLSPNTNINSNNAGMAAFPEMLAPGMHHGMHSPQGSLSPDGGHKTFMDGLQQLNNMHAAYPGHLQHLLVAN